MKDNKQNFYVGIKNSRELRRNVLEASKSVIESMQKEQRIIGLQTQKNHLKDKLKEDVRELKMLFSKLEKTIPSQVFNTNESLPSRPKDRKSMITKVPKAESEIDTMHSRLEDIEQRLKRIKG